MLDSVDRVHNLKNLEDMAPLIEHLDYFIFFGTLLGYHREGNIIEGDDDVDVFMDIKHRDELITILEKSDFTLRRIDHHKKLKNEIKQADYVDWDPPLPATSETPSLYPGLPAEFRHLSEVSIIQVHRPLGGQDTYFDFYLYECGDDKNYIVEKWNFAGQIDNPIWNMHVPKNIIFPLEVGALGGVKVKTPHDVESCCVFLYGKDYRTPRKKIAGYSIQMVDNKPTIFNR